MKEEMVLLVDCSSCCTPLQLPPGATQIRCSICHAFTLIASEPRSYSHALSSLIPSIYPPLEPSSYTHAPPAPYPFTHAPPPAPYPFTHAPPPAPYPFTHAPPTEPYPFTHAALVPSSYNHAPSLPSPFNLAPPGPPPQVHGQKRAVIIGVTYDGENELKGCINDAKRMKFMLMNRFHFPESCILMLNEKETDTLKLPTRQNITMAMHWLVQSCQPGDSLVFHFSGHGNYQKDDDGDEMDGSDETLLPMDHLTSGEIVDDEINAIMVRPLTSGVKLHAIVDACHSGTVLDLPYLCRMDRIGKYTWEDQYQSRPEMRKGTSGGEVFSFTGCDDDQKSADTNQFSGGMEWTGAMTYAFVQAIERGLGTTYGSLLAAMRLTIHETMSKKKGIELVKTEGPESLTSLLDMPSLRSALKTQPPQQPQLSANVKFEVYEKPFAI